MLCTFIWLYLCVCVFHGENQARFGYHQLLHVCILFHYVCAYRRQLMDIMALQLTFATRPTLSTTRESISSTITMVTIIMVTMAVDMDMVTAMVTMDTNSTITTLPIIITTREMDAASSSERCAKRVENKSTSCFINECFVSHQ